MLGTVRDQHLLNLFVHQHGVLHPDTKHSLFTAEILECLSDYKRAFEGHGEDGYAVRRME